MICLPDFVPVKLPDSHGELDPYRDGLDHSRGGLDHSRGELDHSRGPLTQLCITLTPRYNQLLLLIDLRKRRTADTANGNLHSGGDKQVVSVAAHQVVHLHSGGVPQVVLGAAHQLLLLVDLRKRQYHKLYCS